MNAINRIAAAITILLTAGVLLLAFTMQGMGTLFIAAAMATAISFNYRNIGRHPTVFYKKRFTLLVIVLPALWAIHSLIAYFHPGDEYMFYVAGSWPGFPASFFVAKFPSFPAAIAIAIVGLMPMVAMGYTLYRSNVRLRSFAFAVGAAFIIALIGFAIYPLQHGGIPRLTAKHGSLLAYYLVAFNVSLIALAPGVVLSLFLGRGDWDRPVAETTSKTDP